jgi:flavin reductase (DIM6/NTAB) family NADH-FMN oxidoreductase RutF
LTTAFYANIWLDASLPQKYDEKTMTTTIDPEQLRAAMRAWTSGVTVVTAVHEGQQHGMTVNSFTSVSLDPPLVMIALQDATRTRELVHHAQAFGVTILSVDQEDISERFAGRTVDSENRMSGVETETLVTGAPFIKGGLAYFDCRVRQSIGLGPNTMFIGEVVAARRISDGEPLIYHHRQYRRLS